jgi:small subunit ribosomal protein S6
MSPVQINRYMLNFQVSIALKGLLSAPDSPTVTIRGNPEERRQPMRQYELIFIVHPDVEENVLTDIVNRIQSWISDDGGEITNTELWGKKKLAYPIRKQNEGQYVLMHANMTPTFGTELERNLRYLEPVMRYLLVSK